MHGIGSKLTLAQRTELESEQTAQGGGSWPWHCSDRRRAEFSGRPRGAGHCSLTQRLVRLLGNQTFVMTMETYMETEFPRKTLDACGLVGR